MGTPTEDAQFVKALATMQDEVYRHAKAAGWWDDDPHIGVKMALLHTEVSEATEAMRRNNPASEKIPTFTAIEEEFADIICGALNIAAHLNLRLGPAILAKNAHNKTREPGHGKAF